MTKILPRITAAEDRAPVALDEAERHELIRLLTLATSSSLTCATAARFQPDQLTAVRGSPAPQDLYKIRQI